MELSTGTGSSEGKIKDIPSLIVHMDQAAAEVRALDYSRVHALN